MNVCVQAPPFPGRDHSGTSTALVHSAPLGDKSLRLSVPSIWREDPTAARQDVSVVCSSGGPPSS
jgi:hypothetical protein